ncbi:hypothetical protein [Thermodesulfitimonas sp.]
MRRATEVYPYRREKTARRRELRVIAREEGAGRVARGERRRSRSGFDLAFIVEGLRAHRRWLPLYFAGFFSGGRCCWAR